MSISYNESTISISYNESIYPVRSNTQFNEIYSMYAVKVSVRLHLYIVHKFIQ